MATLTADELARIRREIDENLLDIGAEPYIWHRRIYDVIQTNCSSSSTAATTSSTTISAAGAGTITVASATGLVAGYKVQVDVDDQRETVTVKSISGTTLGANFRKTHSGTYPVEIESALTIVRGVLFDLARLQDEQNEARGTGGVKKVDEIEFFGSADGGNRLTELRTEQRRLRGDLARMLGLGDLLRSNAGPVGTFEVY